MANTVWYNFAGSVRRSACCQQWHLACQIGFGDIVKLIEETEQGENQ
jgi:hypothetical protein